MTTPRKKRNTSFNFSPEVVEAVDDIGDKLGLSQTDAIRQSIAIARYIVNLAADGTKIPLLHPDGSTGWLDLSIAGIEPGPDFTLPPKMRA